MTEILPAGHALFQLANSFLALSYVSSDVLVLRAVLFAASVFFCLWAGLILDVALDTVLWNAVFAVINLYHAARIAYSRRPIKFDREEHGAVYDDLFASVGVGRLTFRQLAEQSLIRTLHAGSSFIEAGNVAQNLTVVRSGVLQLHSAPKDGSPPVLVGRIGPMQFVESPQWAGMQVARRKAASAQARAESRRLGASGAASSAPGASTRSLLGIGGLEGPGLAASATALTDGGVEGTASSEIAGVQEAALVDVTIKAQTDVVLMMWPIERLQEFLAQNPEVSSPLNAIIGADVAAKLFSQTKTSKGSMRPATRVYQPMDPPRARAPRIRNVDVPAVASAGGNGGGSAAGNGDGEMKRASYSAAGAGSAAKLDRIAITFGEGLDDDDAGSGDDGAAGGGGNSSDKNGATPSRPSDGAASSAARASSAAELELADVAGSPIRAEASWLEERAARDNANDVRLANILQDRSDLNEHELAALISRGRWRQIRRPGTVLVRQGEPMSYLCMLLDGSLQAIREDGGSSATGDAGGAPAAVGSERALHRVNAGEMVGSLEIMEPEREHIAGETVKSREPCTYVEWDVDDLRDLLGPRPRLRAQLGMVIAQDLARKFRQVEGIKGGT